MTRSYSSLLTWVGLAIAASLILYHTSDRVNALSHSLTTLNTQIEAEQQSLHVLNAEWVYLANPARIDAAVRRHLALLPTAPRRVVMLKDIASLLPLHDGVGPSPTIETAATVPLTITTLVATSLTPTLVTARLQPVIHDASLLKTGHVIATLGSSHINEHMIMTHTAAIEASNDGIGALINSLSLRQ
jgi:hypothetical protein